MRYYLLPVMGQVEESGVSAFRYVTCRQCGNSFRRQEGDMVLKTVQPVGAFSTTMDGDLIALQEVAEGILEAESSVKLRPISLDGAEGTWFQVIPLACFELSASSLRSPREHCSDCGGVARVQFGDYPPLVITRGEGDLPLLAYVCGAPLMTVFSSQILDILSDADSTFAAAEVRLGD